MKMYEHLTAYRHTDGTIEGFKGVGTSKKAATADAVDQMKRKADIVADWKEDDTAFDKDRVITVLSSMTPEQIVEVRKDWNSGARY